MIYAFEGHELDLRRYELRYAGKPIKIEPQVFNILLYLIQHRARVVSKDELLEHLWPGRFVSEATLTSRVMTARKAVGDSGREQRCIQTLHGRGYRFIAGVEERLGRPLPDTRTPTPPPRQQPSEPPALTSFPPAVEPVQPRLAFASTPDVASHTPRMSEGSHVVGREEELAQLHQCVRSAFRGTRQIVFVTGEAGLGKTTLVESFLEAIGGHGTPWIGRGQCLEHHGAGEPYMPVIEAFSRLCQEPDGRACLTLLTRQAPTWVVQMPWLTGDAELLASQRLAMGATRERMLREMAGAIEVLTAERPLVLILEDLHWSDPSTLDLLAVLARRPEPARLLFLGTYRPDEAMTAGHPLRTVVHELKLHRHCQELSLSLLTESAVGAYLAAKLPGVELPPRVTQLVHQRTDGNPLFMVNVINEWIARGYLLEADGRWSLHVEPDALVAGVPESLQRMIERQLQRLTLDEQRLLEVGSVVGVDFSAAAVAAALAREVVDVEDSCEDLTRRSSLLQRRGEQTWPDGTVAGGYGFVHAIYRESLYKRIPTGLCVQWHRQVGVRLEEAYGARARELAAELAEHYTRGWDAAQAVRYLRYAGENALRRSAYQEATAHLRQGLALLPMLLDTPERVRQELALQTVLGAVLGDLKGPAAPEVVRAYTRAWELCQQGGEMAQRVPVLLGLGALSIVRGQFHTAREQAEQALYLAQQAQDAMSRAYSHMLLGHALFYLGELDAARTHLEQSLALYEPQQHHSRNVMLAREAPQVFGLARLASILWYLGYPDQALQRSQAALTVARELGHAYSLVMALIFAAGHHQRRREGDRTRALSEEAIVIAREQGFALRLAEATGLRGWALAHQGQGEAGIIELRQGLTAERSAGVGTGQLYRLALLADAYRQVGQIEAGLQVLEEALLRADHSGGRPWVAELLRLKGEFLLAHGADAQAAAESCFQQALDIARRQQAKALELRALISLSRLWQQHGKRAQAHGVLAELYGWFTEGFDTADLQEAKVLLLALEG